MSTARIKTAANMSAIQAFFGYILDPAKMFMIKIIDNAANVAVPI